jgi:signal transduction histidine kinase
MLAILLSRSLNALRRQSDELRELNNELDAFAGRVAHDLRNLMAPLSFIAALLRGSDSARPPPTAIAERLQRTLDRSLAMLDGLLAFSKSGKPDPLASCSTASVIDDVQEQLAPLIAKVQGTVECDIKDSAVACSRELLNVVVLNILGNALKFLEGRAVRLVRIESRPVDGRCELAIIDSGPGISEHALGRIFEPFYRVPGTKASGSGIGLATVHRIVHAHGGRIRVESNVDQGTTFRVELPLAGVELASLRQGVAGAP